MKTMNNQTLIMFFQKYNQVFADALDVILEDENAFAGIEAENQEEAIHNVVCNAIQGWQNQPLSEDRPDRTGASVLDGVVTLTDALELAKYAAVFCDEQFPDLVKIKLASFGLPMITGLVAGIAETDFSVPLSELHQDNNGPIVAAQYLRLLGEWQCEDVAGQIIDQFAASVTPNEIVAEAVRTYLIAIGQPVIPNLLNRINRALSLTNSLNSTEEYLLIILTDIGKHHPDDEIFCCLRDAFRKMDRKAIGALCLSDYGDRRAVTTLRGWLERHPDVTDRQTIGEILSAIRHLGGDIDDLRHRLKNPS